jgi:hypothetical protein
MKLDFLKPQKKNMINKRPVFETEDFLNPKKIKLLENSDEKQEFKSISLTGSINITVDSNLGRMQKSLSDSRLYISKKIRFGHNKIEVILFLLR